MFQCAASVFIHPRERKNVSCKNPMATVNFLNFTPCRVDRAEAIRRIGGAHGWA